MSFFAVIKEKGGRMSIYDLNGVQTVKLDEILCKNKLRRADMKVIRRIGTYFFHEVCELLDLEKPEVKFTTSGFSSNTMTAQYSSSEHIIYFNELCEKNICDKLHALAFCARAAWQFNFQKDLFFENYKSREECGFKEYNQRSSIIDCYAFASLAFKVFLGYDIVLYQTLLHIKENVKKRELELEKEFLDQNKLEIEVM